MREPGNLERGLHTVARKPSHSRCTLPQKSFGLPCTPERSRCSRAVQFCSGSISFPSACNGMMLGWIIGGRTPWFAIIMGYAFKVSKMTWAVRCTPVSIPVRRLNERRECCDEKENDGPGRDTVLKGIASDGLSQWLSGSRAVAEVGKGYSPAPSKAC